MRRTSTLLIKACRPTSKRYYSRYIEDFKNAAEMGLASAASGAKEMTPPVAPVDGDWGWKICNIPGSNYVTIRRRDDEENIDVNVMADLSFDDLTMHGGQCGELFYFVVMITTSTGTIRYRCLSAECNLRVVSSQVFTSDISKAFPIQPTTDDVDDVYVVPSWNDQNIELISASQEFLEECGINSAFLNFLADLLQHKELSEYPTWWANIVAFLEQHNYPDVKPDPTLIPANNVDIVQATNPDEG